MDGPLISISHDIFEEHLRAAGIFLDRPRWARGEATKGTTLTRAEDYAIEVQFLREVSSRSSSGGRCSTTEACQIVMNVLGACDESAAGGATNRSLTLSDVKRLAAHTKQRVHQPAVPVVVGENGTSLPMPSADTAGAKPQVGGTSARWSLVAEKLFAFLQENEGDPVVDLQRALRFMRRVLPSQRSLMARHADTVSMLLSENITLDELEKFILSPLRSFLLNEPRPSNSTRSTGAELTGVAASAVRVLVERRRDTSLINVALQHIDEKASRSSRMRSLVARRPQDYFRFPPCPLRDGGLLHLATLSIPLLRRFCFVARRRLPSLVNVSPSDLRVRVLRCLDRAEEMLLGHNDRCDRCSWVEEAADPPAISPKVKGAKATVKAVPQAPHTARGSAKRRLRQPPCVELSVAIAQQQQQPLSSRTTRSSSDGGSNDGRVVHLNSGASPRINSARQYESAKRQHAAAPPLQVHEERFVRNVFRRAMEEHLV